MLLTLHPHLPTGLHLVPVDFDHGESAWEALRQAGFEPTQPAVVASTGVSMYLSGEANLNLLK